MGRGRAKAKQTKVARDLKYRTHETDFGALAQELHGDKDQDENPTRPSRTTATRTTQNPPATEQRRARHERAAWAQDRLSKPAPERARAR